MTWTWIAASAATVCKDTMTRSTSHSCNVAKTYHSARLTSARAVPCKEPPNTARSTRPMVTMPATASNRCTQEARPTSCPLATTSQPSPETPPGLAVHDLASHDPCVGSAHTPTLRQAESGWNGQAQRERPQHKYDLGIEERQRCPASGASPPKAKCAGRKRCLVRCEQVRT